ncbi:MAG: diguanylate cyclase, partial [Noviherbaspirillum sp.]
MATSTSTLTYASAAEMSKDRDTAVDKRFRSVYRFTVGGKAHARWRTSSGTLQDDADDSGGIRYADASAADRASAGRPRHLSQRDALTGLFNRYWFQEQLEQWVARASRSGQPASLLYLDLDDFKCINDTYGYGFGDVVLTSVAMEISFRLQGKEILARLGGDEFALLVADAGKQEAEAIAGLLLKSMEQMSITCNGVPLRLTASVGVATFPGDAGNSEELLACAEIAMYEAKSTGKNTWRAYHPDNSVIKDAVQRRFWDDRLQHALEHGLLRTHLQGIYDISTRCLSHMEVLLRMQDADDPALLVMPDMFIPPAEKSGRILAVDRWVIGESVRLLSRSPE